MNRLEKIIEKLWEKADSLQNIFNLVENPSPDNPIVQLVKFNEIKTFTDDGAYYDPGGSSLYFFDSPFTGEFDDDIYIVITGNEDNWEKFLKETSTPLPSNWKKRYGESPSNIIVKTARAILGKKYSNIEIRDGKIVFKGKWTWMNEALLKLKKVYQEKKK